EGTRAHADVYLGASPRASIMLLRASRAFAAAARRDYVIPDDVKALAAPVLGHRIIVTADAAMAGRDTAAVITDILATVDVPIAERECCSRRGASASRWQGWRCGWPLGSWGPPASNRSGSGSCCCPS